MKTGANRFTNKVAVVAGSSYGIGFAIAQRLAEEGASVMVSSRKQANVDRAVEQLKSLHLKVEGCVCHVGNADHRTNLLKQTKETFGGVDILVSNAATNPGYGPLLNITESIWDKIMDTNLKATFFLCKEANPYMKERGGGSMLLVSSVSAYINHSNLRVYKTSKAAMLGLVQAMVPQTLSLNIRVNCLAPGIVATKFSEVLIGHEEGRREMKKYNVKRFGKPEDMAGPAAFLLSDDAAYITGETLLVTGGMAARL